MNKQEELTETLQGLPTLALLPAKQFSFTVSSDRYMFKMPNKGKFSDIDSEFFAEDDSEFEIYSEGNVNISIVTKLLFATRQYPDMEPNQLFCPINFKLDGDDVVMYGQIVTMVGVEDD
jgi:hypothetical protein